MGEFVLILIPKSPILNNKQLERLSAIFEDIGQVATGSIIIPYLLDKSNPPMTIIGILIAVINWLLSLWISRRIYE